MDSNILMKSLKKRCESRKVSETLGEHRLPVVPMPLQKRKLSRQCSPLIHEVESLQSVNRVSMYALEKGDKRLKSVNFELFFVPTAVCTSHEKLKKCVHEVGG